MLTKREALIERANALVGCGYVYGATGWICTEKRLEQQARQYPEYAKQIEKYGPKWLGKPCYDCAQLTREVAKAAGMSLPSGSTSQWRAAGLWQEKGVMATLPDLGGIFLFTLRDGAVKHTGVSVGGGMEVEARGHAYGVVRRAISDTSYTNWASLAIDYDAPADAPNPTPGTLSHTTLRKGMSGEEVKLLQERLMTLGYSLAPYGADGKFGAVTKAAVQQFQRDHALAVDGIVGTLTWAALDALFPSGTES